MSEPTFAGTSEQQSLAAEIFRLMVAQGQFFAEDAPIRQTLGNLTEFLAAMHKQEPATMKAAIDAALSANHEIFVREQHESDVIYTTSRLGYYRPRQMADTHTFKRRLYEPESPLPVDDISVVVSTSRPVLTTVEPVYISDYWQQSPGVGGSTTEPVLLPSDPADALPVAASAEALPPDAGVADEAVPAAVLPQPEAVAESAVPSIATFFALPDGTTIDLTAPTEELLATHGAALQAALLQALDNDPLDRIVHFGTTLYPGGDLATLGKNDLRRIRDDIVEAGAPLLDQAIIEDLYHSQRQADYEGFRFSLNYRLSREKDFEYVGVPGANLWSAKGLPTIGTKRVKAAEMAQLTGYLPDGLDDSLEDQSLEAIAESGQISHFLTFFEWTYGVLPLDAALAALLPPPVLPDQRSAVLTFDSPQHFANYPVEVRYPTGNRGGWLQGLEEFFQEYLVAGALITITRTDAPNIFTIQYEEAGESLERLLTLDEKKNKFGFADTTYFALVDDTRLLAQNTYGRLRNLKSLPMNDRRKGDLVLRHVFAAVGEKIGNRAEPAYQLDLDTIVVAFSVLRPVSRSYVQSLIAADAAVVPHASDPNVFTFTPEREATDEQDDDENWGYDDDE